MIIKQFLLFLYLFLLVSTATPITLDELLNSYDWNVDNDMVNITNINYYNLDSDSNGKFDKIVFNLSTIANTNLRFSGYMSESYFEDSKLVSGNDNLIINFSSSDFDQGYYNFSYKIFDSNGDILIDSYNNISYFFNSSLHEPLMVNVSLINSFYENTDADSLYEKLTYNLSFDVNKTGNYNVKLYLNKNETYTTTNNNISLSPGIYNKNLSFSSKDIRKSRLNGTITLENIEITGNDVLFNRKFLINQSTTINSAQFDPETSIILGDFIDKGFDLDSDSLYDFMQLNFTTYFNQSSTFTFIGVMDDYYNQHILDFNESKSYTTGNQTVSLTLNGTEIRKKGISGPYKISYLKILSGIQIFDILLDAYMLLNATYYTHFDPLPKPDLTISFSEIKDLGNNYSTVKVKVQNIGEKTALRALVEIYNNRTDFLDSKTSYFITPNNYKILEFPRIYTQNTSELTVFVDINDEVDESNESSNMDTANTTLDITLGYNNTAGEAPLTISFTATTERGNSPFSFFWDYDDETTGNIQNPEHIFFSEGDYTVTLIVTDRAGITKTASVNITATPASDTTPPDSITGLSAQSKGITWIYWTWINPTDSDFSHCTLYLNNSNIANTTNNYYNATGLTENTTYELRIETVDTNNNINDTLVSMQATTLSTTQNISTMPDLKLHKYWIYGTKNNNIEFNASWYYPESGITSTLWDFGDSSTSTSQAPSHTYTQAGNYTVQLTINSQVNENITVFVKENPSYNYESPLSYFSKGNESYEAIAAAFGKAAINGFITDNDELRVYAVVKITGDNDITTNQVRLESFSSKECWNIGNNYFKCYIYKENIGNAVETNSSFYLRLRNDSSHVIARMKIFVITESQPPEINLSLAEQYKREGNFNFDYTITDIAYTGMGGSGLGILEIYNNSNLVQSINIDSDSYSGSYTLQTDAITEGEEISYELCFKAYDRTRLNSTECRIVVLDKKSPQLNNIEIQEDTSNIPRDGLNITITANISDHSPLTVYANFSEINIDNPSGYENKQADSCTKYSDHSICVWNDITLKVDNAGHYNIGISYTDAAGNSGQTTATKTIGITNNAPVLTVSDITVDEGDTITINPSATDSDGDTITYTYSDWMTSNTHTTNYNDAGTYQVTVVADDGHGGTDLQTITITVNNVLVQDLEINSLIYKPDNPFTNEPITLRFLITNVGEKKVSNIKWSIIDSSATVSEQQNTFDLEVNEDMTVYALIKYSNPGTYNPLIKVDPSNNIAELSEINNEQSISITVGWLAIFTPKKSELLYKINI